MTIDPNAEFPPSAGFPDDPSVDTDVPVVEGVREITQNPNFDASIDDEGDFE